MYFETYKKRVRRFYSTKHLNEENLKKLLALVDWIIAKPFLPFEIHEMDICFLFFLTPQFNWENND